jgi:Skp family chaperone for outer membrane proteins
LEKLRGLLEQRGLKAGSTVLGLTLSGHAVQAAPAGLALSISTAAVLHAPAIGAGLIKGIAMTTVQKSVIATSLAVAIGTGVYQARQASQLRNENESIRQQQAAMTQQIEQLTKDREQALQRSARLEAQKDRSSEETAELLRLRGEVGRLRLENQSMASTSSNEENSTELESLMSQVNRFKARVKELPEHQIPELELITQADWVKVVENNRPPNEIKALAGLRDAAKNHFVSLLANGITKYKQTTKQDFPLSLEELKPYIHWQGEAAVLDNILARYEVLPARAIPSIHLGGDKIISEKAPVDEENDRRYVVGPGSYGGTSFKASPFETLFPAAKAYASAHQGQDAIDPGQLADYVKTDAERDALQKASAALNAYKQAYGKAPESLAELQPYLNDGKQ